MPVDKRTHPLAPLAGGRVNLRGYVRANFKKLYTGGGGGGGAV